LYVACVWVVLPVLTVIIVSGIAALTYPEQLFHDSSFKVTG
jgi:hypothetical protein